MILKFGRIKGYKVTIATLSVATVGNLNLKVNLLWYKLLIELLIVRVDVLTAETIKIAVFCVVTCVM
jgi:hypothetical protein